MTQNPSESGLSKSALGPQPTPRRRLYVVATSHLDTQWRWTVVDTIRDFLPRTLAENFRLFDKHPHFVLSFEGAFRYQLIREYYPQDFERLKHHVASGQWHPAGGMIDAPDLNVVSPESLVRHVLYGNGYFERELGKRSLDVFLPDCFGFPWSLPTIAAHCGLVGFCSGKMIKWKRPGEIPFDFGVWEGPDGSRIACALKPGGYGDGLGEDPRRSAEWRRRVDETGKKSGVFVGFRYFGVGDRGGAPDERSVELLAPGPESADPVSQDELEIIHTASDRIYSDLTAEELEALPRHRGELLLPTHGTGCWTSQAVMKRRNRRLEQLADAAERAASIAGWLGALDYSPRAFEEPWTRFLWHQMHDDLTGTSIPEAYRFSWNDQLLALNQFETILTDAVTAAARGLDTSPQSADVLATLVVYNPLARRRRDLVRAEVDIAPAVDRVGVVASDGRELSAQIRRRGQTTEVLFEAPVEAFGLSVFEVVAARETASSYTEVGASSRHLENEHYRLELSDDGDIASIFAKKLDRELLASPLRLELLPDRSRRWPAWELLYKDICARPRIWSGPAEIELLENGPVRTTLRVTRRHRGSTLVQDVSLTAGERVDIDCRLDWRTSRRILKAAFRLAPDNPRATYDLGLGAISRGVNRPEKYEVPAQQWADLSAGDGGWGISILNDSKYGWDRPDEATLRLTLARSPRARHHFRHQRHQDFGSQRFTVSLYAHRGDWSQAATVEHGERLNQPLVAFATAQHPGPLGRQLSLLELGSAGGDASLMAFKRREDATAGEPWVARIRETAGRNGHSTRLAGRISSWSELDGCEKPLGKTRAAGDEPRLDGGALSFESQAFRPRTFALELEPPAARVAPLASRFLDLELDHAAVSFHGQAAGTDFDGAGHSLPGELLPESLSCGEVPFRLGAVEPGGRQALLCRGQSLDLGAGEARLDTLFLLAATVAEGEERVRLELDGNTASSLELTVHPYSGFFGQKNRWRQYRGWRLGRELPGYRRRATVAWVGTHRHDAEIRDQPYEFCYLYRYEVALPAGARRVKLPEQASVRIFAATLAQRQATALCPAQSLYD